MNCGATNIEMLSYGRAVSTELRVGIVPVGFPENTIKKDEVRPLQKAVIDNIITFEAEYRYFEDRWLSQGALLAHCAATKDKE